MKKNVLAMLIIVLQVALYVPVHAYAQVPAAPQQQHQATAVTQNDESDETDTVAVTKDPTEDLVTLDFKDADIINVLRILSLKSGVNIVTGPEVKGTVTIRLTDVPWKQALDVVLRTYGYVYERKDNIIRVTTKENLQTEELSTEAFVLNYSTADEIQNAISEIISERGRIKAVPRTNTLIVTDVPQNIYKIREIIKRLDRRTPQIYIDSKIVRTELGVTENLGIDWNIAGSMNGGKRPTVFPFIPEGGMSDKWSSVQSALRHFYPQNDANEGTTAINGNAVTTSSSFGSGDFPLASESDYVFGALDFTTFSAVLNLLKSRSNTQIVSNPRIVTLNHKKALVQVGQEIGVPTFERNENTGSFEVSGYDSRNVGVVLSVTPHVNDKNEILVELAPEISSFDGFSAIGGTNLSFPSFTTTRANTQVLIENRETIAIGGLLADAKSGTYNKVPILGDIPAIGKIFRSTRQAAGSNRKIETIFFITCTVVDLHGAPEEFTKPVKIAREAGA